MGVRNAVVAIVVSIAVAGCAAGAKVAMMSDEKIPDQSLEALCENLRFNDPDRVNPIVLTEIRSRTQFDDREWDAVLKKQVYVGMSEAAMICSIGKPDIFGSVRDVDYGSGTERRYKYFYDAGTTGERYIYVKNGYVTGWSW